LARIAPSPERVVPLAAPIAPASARCALALRPIQLALPETLPTSAQKVLREALFRLEAELDAAVHGPFRADVAASCAEAGPFRGDGDPFWG
jgi:hypothetical protein